MSQAGQMGQGVNVSMSCVKYVKWGMGQMCHGSSRPMSSRSTGSRVSCVMSQAGQMGQGLDVSMS